MAEGPISMTPERAASDTAYDARKKANAESDADVDAMVQMDGIPRPSQPASNAEPHKRRFVSWGEIAHREITYRGVDWVLNSILAGMFVFLTHRTERGFDLWERYAGGFSRWALKPFYKEPEKLKETVDATKNFLGIIVGGGTLVIPPIMLLENKGVKKSMVKGIDTLIYGHDAVANDPKFAESYKEIDHEPKKGFWTGMAARGFALTPMYFIMTRKSLGGQWFNENYYPKIANGSKWLSEKVGIRPNKWLLEHGDTENEFGKEVYRNHWDFIHHMIGYDFGMTIFYAIMHEFWYNVFSKASRNHKEHREERHEEAQAHAAPAATLQNEQKQELPVDVEEKPRAKVAQVEAHTTIHPPVPAAQQGMQ